VARTVRLGGQLSGEVRVTSDWRVVVWVREFLLGGTYSQSRGTIMRGS
jgi:hypothetical protein